MPLCDFSAYLGPSMFGITQSKLARLSNVLIETFLCVRRMQCEPPHAFHEESLATSLVFSPSLEFHILIES